LKKVFFILAVIFVYVGCGYKPASYYAKNEMTGKVYVELSINITNAQNSVYIKDAMNEMILDRFNLKLTSNKIEADTYVKVALTKATNSAITSDNDGYAKSYRTTVTINISYQKIKIKNSKPKLLTLVNYYDYSVDADSVVTEQKKQEAIKLAATKALSDMFSKIAINSMKE
jgi:hypothetical protein